MDAGIPRTSRFLGFEDPTPLAKLLEPTFVGGDVWETGEWAALAHHLLNTTIWLDIAEQNQITAAAVHVLCGQSAGKPIRSYYDLFEHDAPGLDLLRLVRGHGKSIAQDPGPLLPRPLGLLLHQATTAQAWVEHSTWLGSTRASDLSASLEWFEQQEWTPPRMRRKLRSWQRELQSTLD